MQKLNQKLAEAAKTAFPAAALVFGEGLSKKPLLAVIGEAPGAEEEKLRRPFVGKAGKNLDSFLETLGLARADVYITNLVKLHPTQLSKANRVINRPPTKQEVAFFAPYLMAELQAVAPQYVATLGNFSLRAMLGDEKATIGAAHGQLSVLASGMKLFPLYHPASIIYNQSLKSVYAADLAILKNVLDAAKNAL